MKTLTRKKKYLLAAGSAVLLYLAGFFLMPPWVFASPAYTLRHLPQTLHGVLYEPLLGALPENSVIRAIWWQNAQFWCARMDGCLNPKA